MFSLKFLSLHVLTPFVVSFLAVSASAVPTLSFSEKPYRGGKDRYENPSPLDAMIVFEGRFLELPLDPARPSRGSFDLFYRLSKNFDPSKPTAIFFNGGPGGSSDGLEFEEQFADFNFIYFDQRGTSFSHLRTAEDMLDPENFSSELIARDAEALRRHLGIEKVSIYGHSYGTVPATIYGNLFPEHTRAVVLEGVIFDGTPDLWRAPHRLKRMQRYFDRLPEATRQKIQAITDGDGVPKDWLSKMIRVAMYDSNFSQKVGQQLDDLMEKPLAEATNLVWQKWNQSLFPIFIPDSTFFGSYMMAQISCQELSSADPTAAWDAELIGGKFVPRADPEIRAGCLQISGMEARLNRTFFATNYPLNVPVTYLEGTTDGATAAPNAVRHMKKVARRQAQLIFVTEAGHSPVQDCLDTHFSDEQEKACEKVLETVLKPALAGESVSASALKSLGGGGNRWVIAKRPRAK